jgi:pyridoxamine 5'-phosphate oxidase family protein
MSVFTPAEIAYLQSQRIGRIATVGPDGQPHVVPVGFRYNPEHDSIDIGGREGFTKRKHYRDLVRNPKVGYVVDDLPSVNPWTIRGIEIRGEAEVLTSGGESIVPGFGPDMIRIRAKRIVSWGIEATDAPATARPATEQAARRSIRRRSPPAESFEN